jgi:L-ascorbate metabolism protein UlaG (beta-lactamase superfamily)
MFTFNYYGFAAVLVNFEKRFLIDPGIIQGKPLIAASSAQPSYILVTQTTREHMGNASDIARNRSSILLGNKQVIDAARSQEVPGFYLEQIEDGKTLDVGANITITAYELRRGGFLAPQNTAFHIYSEQGSVLHLGHAKEFKRLKGLEPDLLCVPVAGKKQGTFNAKEAVEVSKLIQPRYVLPISGNEPQISEYSSLLMTEKLGIVVLQPKIKETQTIL